MFRSPIERVRQYHPKIAAALRARDGFSARALISDHLESVTKAWSAFDKLDSRRRKTSTKGGRKRIGAVGNGSH
jgi:DNA-binding FadR family transcriptional regulator